MIQPEHPSGSVVGDDHRNGVIKAGHQHQNSTAGGHKLDAPINQHERAIFVRHQTIQYQYHSVPAVYVIPAKLKTARKR